MQKKNYSDQTIEEDIVIKGLKQDNLNFSRTTFKNKVVIEDCKLKECSFFRATFCQTLSLINVKFLQEVNFDRVNFVESLFAQNCTFKNVSFDNSKFNKMVYFENVIFKEITSFQKTLFCERVTFEGSMFCNKVMIVDTKSMRSLTFLRSVFENLLIISRSSFDKNLIFEMTTINGLNCSKSNMHNSLILDGSVTNELSIVSSQITGVLDTIGMQVSQANKLLINLENTIFNGCDIENLSFENFKNRGTLRAIKQSFVLRGDSIQGMCYFVYEMRMYRNSLQQKLKIEKTNFYEKLQILSELFMLNINRVSNNYGVSWLRGIVFTTSVSLLFFFLFLALTYDEWDISYTWASLGMTIKAYLQFFNVTDWDYTPFSINNYNWAYIPLFIGRIFISYGVYQTVQAFRKYRFP